jgi:signal transduction histidine kinase
MSLAIMGLVVAGVGLSGTAYVVGYLHERMTAHGVEHNREIAQRLLPLLAPRIEPTEETVSQSLQDAVTLYGTFGYRIVLLDAARRIMADSHRQTRLPKPLEQTWLADMAPLEVSDNPEHATVGPAMATAEDGHAMLVWLQGIGNQTASSPQWVLGVASDQHNLNDFLGELHWHLDGVLLVTYLLIGVLGALAMRSIGRAYERKLESQVRERTLALDEAHRDVLAKTRLATIGQTATVLAHEMRNPLASIKLAFSGLQSRDDMPERTRRRLDLVLGEVDRLDALLSQTLEFARPVQIATRPVLLDQVLTRVIEQQQPLIDKQKLRVLREVCADCLAVRLDEDKMVQALLNLLKNAIEASPEGAEIGISVARVNDEVVLQMANGGEPLTAETIQQAFDPFFTTKPHGSGLGLGMVKRVVEAHGGNVSLDSAPEYGTRVTVRLPMNHEADRK